jgi:archaemetzincin
MRTIRLVPVGDVDKKLLEVARAGIITELRVACRDVGRRLDPEFAFHSEREQYHSTALLERLASDNPAANGEVVVGITGLDLFIPILTFVFGEAQLGGRCAIVSYYRLRQEFYGLPADADIAGDRLVKEAVHEIGHTFGLTHCEDYECVMASSHAVEWLDVKRRALCASCRSRAGVR